MGHFDLCEHRKRCHEASNWEGAYNEGVQGHKTLGGQLLMASDGSRSAGTSAKTRIPDAVERGERIQLLQLDH